MSDVGYLYRQIWDENPRFWYNFGIAERARVRPMHKHAAATHKDILSTLGLGILLYDDKHLLDIKTVALLFILSLKSYRHMFSLRWLHEGQGVLS